MLPITREDNLQDHYPTNDLQMYHLNSVQLVENGFSYTTLSGLVCRRTSGYPPSIYSDCALGAHAIRSISREDFMFVVSPRGEINFGNWKERITSTLEIRSKWIHDAIFLDRNRILVTDSEHNRLVVISPHSGEELDSIRLEGLGEAPQFMDVSPVNEVSFTSVH